MSVDIYLEHSAVERKPFGFGFAKAKRVTGNERRAQHFLKVLLTPIGSDLSGNITGTNFSDLVAGNYADTEYIDTMVTMAIDAALAQVRSASADLALASASVVQVVHEIDGFQAYIRLTAPDGQTATLMLPSTPTQARVVDATKTPQQLRYVDFLEGL